MGFAGSGLIEANNIYDSLIEGIATRTLSIDVPTGFDIYYLVEKDEKKAEKLRKSIGENFPKKLKKFMWWLQTVTRNF